MKHRSFVHLQTPELLIRNTKERRSSKRIAFETEVSLVFFILDNNGKRVPIAPMPVITAKSIIVLTDRVTGERIGLQVINGKVRVPKITEENA